MCRQEIKKKKKKETSYFLHLFTFLHKTKLLNSDTSKRGIDNKACATIWFFFKTE